MPSPWFSRSTAFFRQKAMENTPQTLPLPAAETRCLGHCEQRKTICKLQEACARQVTIRCRNEPISTDVQHHMCGAGAAEFFIPIQEAA